MGKKFFKKGLKMQVLRNLLFKNAIHAKHRITLQEK